MTETRNLPPTLRKRAEARRRGHVPRSPLVGLSAACLVVAALAEGAVVALAGTLRRGLQSAADAAGESPEEPAAVLATSATQTAASAAWAVAPILAALVVAGLLAGLMQNGPLFSTRAFAPDAARLSPGRGWSDQFSAFGLLDALRSSAVVLVIVVVVALTLVEAWRGAVTLPVSDAASASVAIGATAKAVFLRVGLVAAALALADVVYRRVRYDWELRMSRRERRLEQRQSEGDPRTRAYRRRAHERLVAGAGARLSDARLLFVGRTDVVALAYDPADGAPRVVAVARGDDVPRLRQDARRARIRETIAPELVADLARLDVGDLIPQSAYERVAEHLAPLLSADDTR